MICPTQRRPFSPSGWVSGVSVLLTSALILVTPGFTKARLLAGGEGNRRPDPTASSILQPAVTGASIFTASSVGMKLVATPDPVGSQGLQALQESQGSHGSPNPHGSQGSQESKELKYSRGSKGYKRSKGSQRLKGSQGFEGSKGSEGETKTAPSTTTPIDAANTTSDTPTSTTGFMASSSGPDSIGAVSRLPVSSNRILFRRGCLRNGLGRKRKDGQTDDCERDGPQPDEDGNRSLQLCSRKGNDADYSELLSGTGSLMERTVGSTSGCPNHVYLSTSENLPTAAPWSTIVPAYPLFLADDGTTTFTGGAGAVGIMLNGVVEFSSWAPPGVAGTYQYSTSYEEADDIDVCGGQSTSDGQYHYQTTAGCLQEQAMIAAGTGGGSHTPQLGWAYDGFPIYGQLGPDGVEMKACGQDGADKRHCLDACSGYEADLPEVDSFKYRYYTSCGSDESFSHSAINCYRGCCPRGMECNYLVESCDSKYPEPGYSDDYIPVAADPLDEAYEPSFSEGYDLPYIGDDYSARCALYLGPDESTYSPRPRKRLPTGSSSTMTATAPTTSSSGRHTASPTDSAGGV